MNNIKGFTFYKSYYESLKNLKEKDKKIILNAILEYVFEDKIPNFSGINLTIWTLIEPNLSVSKNKSNDNSGAPKGNKNACKTRENAILENNQKTIKKQSNDNQKTMTHLYDKDKDKDKDKECVIYNNQTPHTHTEIFDFCSSFFQNFNYNKKDLERSCKKFFNYYNEKNWEGVKDWHDKLEMWIDDDVEKGKIKIDKMEEEYYDEAGFLHRNGRRIL